MLLHSNISQCQIGLHTIYIYPLGLESSPVLGRRNFPDQ